MLPLDINTLTPDNISASENTPANLQIAGFTNENSTPHVDLENTSFTTISPVKTGNFPRVNLEAPNFTNQNQLETVGSIATTTALAISAFQYLTNQKNSTTEQAEEIQSSNLSVNNLPISENFLNSQLFGCVIHKLVLARDCRVYLYGV